jgi:hypothetical protein
MTEIQNKPDPDLEAQTPTARAYRLTREGRRQAMILLLGVASLWVFALWTLITLFQDGLDGVEWVSLLLMSAILVVAPLVAWTLLEESQSQLTANAESLRYQSLSGIDITYKWEELVPAPDAGRGRLARLFVGDNREKKEVDSEDVLGEEDTRLYSVPDHTAQIANPVARILHRLAHGSHLPVYAGIEKKEELLATIKSHVSAAAEDVDSIPTLTNETQSLVQNP